VLAAAASAIPVGLNEIQQWIVDIRENENEINY